VSSDGAAAAAWEATSITPLSEYGDDPVSTEYAGAAALLEDALLEDALLEDAPLEDALLEPVGLDPVELDLELRTGAGA
jgi:hypothetical protein